MTNNQANARELLALKRTLHNALTLTEIRAINWGAIANAVAVAFDRGWRGDELAKFCIEGLDRAEDPGAVIYTTLRDLGTMSPPREITPTAPTLDRAQLAAARSAAATPEAVHANVIQIRDTIARRTR